MTLIFKSNKDGQTGSKYDGYCSYCPNTYSVYRDNERVGQISQMKDPEYNFRTTCWIGTVERRSFKAQYLSALKAQILDADARKQQTSADPLDEPICCKYATAGVAYKPNGD